MLQVSLNYKLRGSMAERFYEDEEQSGTDENVEEQQHNGVIHMVVFFAVVASLIYVVHKMSNVHM